MSDTPGWAAPEGGGDRPPQPPPPPPAPGYGGWGGQPPAQQPGGWGQYGGWTPGAPKPGVIPLRPLGLGEILDGALATMRQYPKATLGLAAVVVTASQLLQFLVQAASLDTLREAQRIEDAVPALAVSIGAAVIGGIAGLVLAGMLVIVMGEAVLGRPISLGDVWRRASGRIGALIGAAILTGLVMFAGFLACVLPFFYFWIALQLTTPALMLEGQPVTKAMRRSRELVRGAWWRCFGITLLAFLIAGVLGFILSAPFVLAGGAASFFGTGEEVTTMGSLALQTLGGIVSETIVSPFTAGVTALLYIDRRMRVEGLDVTLAQAAAAPPPPPPMV